MNNTEYLHPPIPSQKIVFRDVTGHLPLFGDDDKYGEGRWWYAELHLRNRELNWWGPVGLAVIHEPTNGRPVCLSALLLDSARHHGIGIRAAEAIGERWPDIYWTSTPGSLGFHQKLVDAGIARYRNGVYDFVPKRHRKN
jgi:hypothetical protein